MKIKIIFIAIFIALTIPLITMAATSSDAYNYVPMEAIPGQNPSSDFCSYVQAIYDFGIAAVGICAMFMIIIGGFMYASSAGNNASMEKAKGVITDAIIGLILAMGSWLILYIINPDLIQCNMPSSGSSSGGGPGGGPGGSALEGNLKNDSEIQAELDAQETLRSMKITPASTGGNSQIYCDGDLSTGCTDVALLVEKHSDDLKKLSETVGPLTLTGGSEKTGHLCPSDQHGQGNAADFMVTPEQAKSIHDNADSLGIKKICSADNSVSKGCNNSNEPPGLIHVEFNN